MQLKNAEKLIMKNGEMLLDSNIVINYLNGKIELNTTSNLFIPIIVVGELFYGAEKSHRTEENKKNIIEFLTLCKIVNVDYVTAQHYANIKAHLKNIGRPIPENDIWIAALANQYEIPLVTNDNHFRFIPSIKINTMQS